MVVKLITRAELRKHARRVAEAIGLLVKAIMVAQTKPPYTLALLIHSMANLQAHLHHRSLVRASYCCQTKITACTRCFNQSPITLGAFARLGSG